jgi:hypothetical protein
MKQLVPPELGQNILIVLDECPACLDMVYVIVGGLPALAQRKYTLMYCCALFQIEDEMMARVPDAMHEAFGTLEAEEHEFQLAQQYLYQATDILHAAGVPHTHIRIARAIGADSLVGAIATELGQGGYTGIVVRQHHHDMVNGLQIRGIMDTYGQIPGIVMWVPIHLRCPQPFKPTIV